MTRSLLAVLLAVSGALVASACASSPPPTESVPAGKPSGSGDEALGALSIDATSSERAPRPAIGSDLRARAFGPSPIGRLGAEHVDEYVVAIEVVNDARVPVALSDATIQVRVEKDGRVLRGCDGGAPAAIESPRVLAPDGSLVARATLPCPLGDRGRYEVVAVITLGDADLRQPEQLIARMPLVIDDSRPAFTGVSSEPAEEAGEADPVAPREVPYDVRRQEPGIIAP